MKVLGWVMGLVLTVAFGIFWQSEHQGPPKKCGEAMAYDPFAAKVFRDLDRGGTLIAHLVNDPPPDVATIQHYVDGTLDVVGWMWQSLTNPLKALTGGQPATVNPYSTVQPCTPPDTSCNPAPQSPATPPFDPKNASYAQGLGGSSQSLKGPEMVADAMIKAGFPASEIPMGIAVVDAESGFNPKAYNPYGQGMRGMFQNNWGAHPDKRNMGNWYDPYVSARVAYKIWSAGDGTGRHSWHPWSTWRTARANASKYARFASIAPSTPSKPEPQPKNQAPGAQSNVPPPAQAHPVQPPAVDCVTTTGAAGTVSTAGQGSVNGLTVGTWNVLFSNSPSQINAGAGFADIVGLQEIRHNSFLPPPGYGVTNGKMAVPIIWNEARIDNVWWKRKTVLTGYARDKSVVYGVWRNKTTGKQFAAMNSHLLVQGGSGWAKQAANLNRVRAELVATGLPVIFMADYNAPVTKIRNTFGGAFAGNAIDQVMSFGAKPTKDEVLSKFGSDHHRVRVTYTGGPLYPVKRAPQTSQPQGGGSSPASWDKLNPRTVDETVAWMRTAAAHDGMNGEQVSNRCERYMNLAYGRNSGYGSARGHWQAGGERHTGGTPPKGALVFFDSHNAAGHVAFSTGGGMAISTDFNGSRFSSGSIAEGSISQISRVMGGRVLGWRPPTFGGRP